MSFSDYSTSARREIASSVEAILDEYASSGAGFSGDSAKIFSIMKDYAVSGKMLRGILACLGRDLFRTAPEPDREGHRDAVRLAAALELFQAGLLVHDDIMDKDEMRRGMPTMHKTFERLEAEARGRIAAKNPLSSCEDLGEALGICAGDIFYFIAWQLISSFGTDMGELFSRQLVNVCLAQIKDVRLGKHEAFPPLSDSLEVYLYKTASYTISLPLCAGALAAGRSDALPALEELGLNLGILFQIQDDYLGLFGNEEELGKPIGSDIREGKKTPYMIMLADRLDPEERKHFDAIFGSESIRGDEVEYIRELVKTHKVDAKVRELAESYARKAEDCIARLPERIPCLDRETLGCLREFVDYSLSRKF